MLHYSYHTVERTPYQEALALPKETALIQEFKGQKRQQKDTIGFLKGVSIFYFIEVLQKGEVLESLNHRTWRSLRRTRRCRYLNL